MINFDNILEELFKCLENLEFKKVYIIRNIYGKISLYFLMPNTITSIVDRLKNDELPEFWFENVSEINEGSMLINELDKISHPINNRVYFAERRSTKLNWFNNNTELNGKKPLDGYDTKIITFYSYKGGVGRTTALVSSALELVKRGNTIVLVDFDLEAPGLATLFFNDEEAKEYSGVKGVIEFLLETNIKGNVTVDDLEDYYFRITDTEIIGSEGGKLIIIPAGVTTDEQAENYLEKLSRIDFNMNNYRNNESPLTKLFKLIAEKFSPDFIFIDSRTGINDVGGLALTKYADLAITIFYGNQQNMYGLRIILPVLKKLDIPILLVNSPVPTNNTDMETEIDYYLDSSYELFCNYYYNEGKIPERFDQSAEHYPINIMYNTEATVLNNTNKLVKLITVNREDNPYIIIANHISKTNVNHHNKIIEKIQSVSSTELLEAMSRVVPEANITAASEHEFTNNDDLIKRFYPRKDYKFIFEHDRFLILGEKGVGKTALFTVLSHKEYAKYLAEYCGISDDDFASTEWLVGLSNSDYYPTENNFSNLIEFNITQFKNYWLCLLIRSIFINNYNWIEFGTIKQVKDLITADVSSLKSYSMDISFMEKLEEWLNLYQKECIIRNKKITIIYDYLDSLIPGESELRGKLIAALISFWFNNLSRYKNIRAKIFLRQDIFDREVQSSLTDKVKIKNYSVELKWEYDQLLNIIWKRMLEENNSLEEYFKSVLKEKFNLVRDKNNYLGYIPFFSDEANRIILDNLLGNYMGSNNKAFPYNWIIYHLSDTHSNISPRSIITLFAATARTQLTDNKSDDFIIRPYNMEISMEVVSKIRLADLKEEFPEFEDIFNNLKEYVPQFPVEEKDLKTAITKIKHTDEGIQEVIEKLMVIGVIKSYKPKSKDTSLRYHIPDIYLIGMNLKRTGPGFHKRFMKK